MPLKADRPELFFHSPCFDGIVSAVLTLDYVETKLGWGDTTLTPINYKVKEAWLAMPLPTRSAVVDFLYHPRAAFWADHHPTTFLTPEVEADFHHRRSDTAIYDPSAPSCSELLWHHLQRLGHRSERYEALAKWASITDAARYPTVDDALDGKPAALQINNSLAAGDADYCVFLVNQLRVKPLGTVARLAQVRARHHLYRAELTRSLADVAQSIRLLRGVALYEVDAGDRAFPRYAPYHFYPEARYSVGLLLHEDSATITAMRNPWREFPSEHLGHLFEAFGGGGHQRVASVVLRGPAVSDAEQVFARIADVLQADAPVPRRPATVVRERHR